MADANDDRTAAIQRPDDELVITFDQPGTFEALQAAEAWCRKRGISYGSSDRTGTIGLLVGDYVIAKWQNLTPSERRACHGRIIGDGRNGPVTLRISRAALARASVRDG